MGAANEDCRVVGEGEDGLLSRERGELRLGKPLGNAMDGQFWYVYMLQSIATLQYAESIRSSQRPSHGTALASGVDVEQIRSPAAWRRRLGLE